MAPPATASQADRFFWSTKVGEFMSDHLAQHCCDITRIDATSIQHRQVKGSVITPLTSVRDDIDSSCVRALAAKIVHTDHPTGIGTDTVELKASPRLSFR
jgi:hypothetical protein